mmetsp:Transcript_26232/g.84703  ORF Transcript_26232/g.84703 Transcript_26232/m.84703 type:complete len:650 (+) Transcript_26232:122-2071(+)
MSIVTCTQRLAAAQPEFIPGTEQFCQAWCTASIAMGITDFDVCSVDWNSFVPWAETSRPGWGAVMPEYAGYLIVILFGVFFSVITSIMVWFEKTFGGLVISSEHFNTAGRNIKTGLTASVIVSQWTWAATLLQSSNVAWRYGLSGPFWYAAGASIQVLLFGILAIEVKKKAPNMHTFLEMIDVRWGKAAHMTFLFFGFATNLIVTGMLLLGGAAVVYQTSSMATEAALFLIPVGVIIYTMFGGLKATFLASYIHTTIIFIGLVLFVTYVYAVAGDCGADLTKQCNSIGSASILWERLTFVAALPSVSDAVTAGAHHGPVPNNRGGSYLTMLSNDGLSFGVINIIGNFGTVFVDQSYWQSAIAARPASAHKGYILGGLVWFTIPMALATSLGLASNALNVKLSSDEAGSGLAPPAAAIVLLGQGGGILIIIMLFMAITSTGSAECIAVASLVAYDIYRKYINPDCTGQQLLRVSRIMVVFYGLVSGFFGWFLYGVGANLGWVYNFMGIMIGSAVLPVSFCILTRYCTAKGAIIGAWGGMISSVITWLVIASTRCSDGRDPERLPVGETCPTGTLDINTTGNLYAQLGGNLVAICMSGIYCMLVTAIEFKFGNAKPFDWDIMRTGITRIEEGKDDVPDEEMSPEFLDSAGK